MISRLSLEHLKLIRKMSNRCEGLRITGCGLVDLVFNHEFLSGERSSPPILGLTFIFLFRALANIVAKFFEPSGRPLGLPDWPGLNCRLTGGRPYPTAPFSLVTDWSDSLIVGLHYRPLRASVARSGVSPLG